MIVQGITVEQFYDAVAKCQGRYANNLETIIGREYSNTRFAARVTVSDTGYAVYGKGDRLAPGQRRSWSGRRIKAACWHVYRDVLDEVFNINPNANVYTAMAKYKGRKGFEDNYPMTGESNIGSHFQPAYMPDLCDCD